MVEELGPMWIIFSIFLVLWLVGIEKFVPPALSLFFFFAMIATAAFALWPTSRHPEQH